MELAIEIIRPVVQVLMVPIKNWMTFVVSSSTYVREMHAQMKKLDDVKARVTTRMESQNAKNLETDPCIPDWLFDVKTIKARVESIPTGGNGCSNLKMRYKTGKLSSDILNDIKSFIADESKFEWTNQQKPLGRVESKQASTSKPFHDGLQSNNLESRNVIFKKALNFLQLNDKSTQKIALCGMAGVGKTTMMEQVKKAVKDSKMFDWVLKVVIGQKPNPINVQQAISEQLGKPLTETIKSTRAERLEEIIKSLSEDAKRKILVILDDLWEEMDLKDIGLVSPLPNNIKMLLTSRETHVCTVMGVEAMSIIRMEVLKDSEPKILFDEIIAGKSSYCAEPELRKIGKDIIKRCGGLPIAVKTIASALRDKNEKYEWEDALYCLQNNVSEVNSTVNEIFKISYNNLKVEDDKAIFLLCGLFPDDFDIPKEHLMRYGWGLKLFNRVRTIPEARSRANTCVGNLLRANLLIESDRVGFVKMHDLVREFVLSNFSNVKQASVVNGGDMSQWPAEDTSQYERLLIKCRGMLEFPVDFNYPNLKLLKLMDGNDSLKFPQEFHQKMQHLEVVAYERMHISSLHSVIPQFGAKLRTLCLHSCRWIHDLSFLEGMTSLQILSIVGCGIMKLPSTIGNWTKLRLLEVTRCRYELHIDDGVFRKLDRLEELYIGFSWDKTVRLTAAGREEMEEMLSRGTLVALEFEFFKNEVQPKNVYFKNLERFRISMGCHLGYIDKKDSFENTLKLVTSKKELVERKINELFNKTENLYLEVKDMSRLEEICSQHSFGNLRVLEVVENLISYIFTIPVVRGLTKLERLTIWKCPVLETLVHVENSGAEEAQEEIVFQKLKFLSLNDLPKLVSLCDNDINVVQLPQLVELKLKWLPNFTSIYPDDETGAILPFFKKEVVIPKLEKLNIQRMENLKQIWPCQMTFSEKVKYSTLRKIVIRECDSVVNLFPCNPLPLLNHLETLQVQDCNSVEVLFNIDLGCADEVAKEVSRLRSIFVRDSRKLKEVWRIKGANNSPPTPGLLITAFQAVERIEITNCKSFRVVCEPTTINFDLGALKSCSINCFY